MRVRNRARNGEASHQYNNNVKASREAKQEQVERNGNKRLLSSIKLKTSAENGDIEKGRYHAQSERMKMFGALKPNRFSA